MGIIAASLAYAKGTGYAIGMTEHERSLDWLLKEKYHGVRTKEFERDVARLDAGEPIDYLIGWTDFLGARIYLNHHPLIPRVETEYWVEKLIHALRDRPPLRILDLFAGSGAIGIALLKAFPAAHVTFGELNPSALEQIKENVTKNSIDTKRTTVLETNIFERVHGSFDLIVANPPYIDSRSNELAANVRAYEPHDALFAPNEGMYFLEELIMDSHQYLAPGGTLAIEFDNHQEGRVRGLADDEGWMRVEMIKDQFQNWRAAFLKRT